MEEFNKEILSQFRYGDLIQLTNVINELIHFIDKMDESDIDYELNNLYELNKINLKCVVDSMVNIEDKTFNKVKIKSFGHFKLSLN